MKSDLPTLMRKRGLDAIVVSGPDGLASANAQYNYLISPAAEITGTVIVKSTGEMYLLHRTMERDEAAKSGMKLLHYEGYNKRQLVRDAGGDRLAAEVELLRLALRDAGVNEGARIGFYGADEQNRAVALLDRLRRAELFEVVAEFENDVISEARETKDEVEAAAIKQSCALTADVMDETRAWLASHAVKDGALTKRDGAPLTVGDAKKFFRMACFSRELEEDHTIFAIGRDAGVPHSRGNAADVLRLGQTIIFDIFPRHAGYYADITRTWCLGYAPDHVAKAYEDVCAVHDAVEARFAVDTPCYVYHELACDMFEQRGHPTQRQNPGGKDGYIHGLGHGFGWSVHEAPGMSLKGARPDEFLRRGTIICNEPGLYYPDDPRGGWGVRLEDDYWFDLQGNCIKLTNVDRELVVKMRS